MLHQLFLFLHSNRTALKAIVDTFVRYIDAGGNLNHPILRYLYTIARNLCVDEYRRIQEIPIPDGYEKSSGNLEEVKSLLA